MKKTLLFLTLIFIGFSASAKIYSIRATLSGANEVPANASTATGTAIGTFDDVSLLLNLTITFNGLTTHANAAHIHKAVVGVNGPVIIPFIDVPAATLGTFSYSGTLIATRATDLLAGLYYVNIHNTSFPGGEIRGQLVATALQVFNSSSIIDFNNIGGYSYTEGSFPNGTISSPYTRSGPLPNNDFTFEATSVQLYGFQDKLTTFNGGQSITLTFKGNNVRKIRSLVRSEDVNGVVQTGNVTVTATTNLGNTAIIIANISSQFAGFRVMNENEYITTLVFSGPSDGQFTTIDDIMFGDDIAQNVALNFDGVDDNVAIPSTVGNFATNDNFTVTTWIKIPSANQPSTLNADNDILEKWSTVGGYPFVIRYLNHTASIGDRFKINVGRWDGTNNPNMFSTITLNDDTWHHIAFVKNGTTLTLYIDGVENNTMTDNTTGTTTNSSPLYVGSRGNNTNYFKGEIDEVRIWNIGKNATQIFDEMLCKTPLSANLVAFYNFNNGVPHDNNPLITQVQDGVGPNHGTLNNFSKTGDASNFVTGQVKYVKGGFMSPNTGASWATAFTDLQYALPANSCNDLFDIWVAGGTYKPAAPNGDVNTYFTIPTGMRLYGGFAGTEKSINQRIMALIHSTNKTTLSGDLNGNDTQFVFTTNRTDNSNFPVDIPGNSVVFDGFTVIGSSLSGAGIGTDGTNVTIKNSRVIDNTNPGLYIFGGNATIANCSIMGNNGGGIYITNSTTSIKESLFANNSFFGIYINVSDGTRQTTITNSTIASNANFGILVEISGGASTNTLKNSVIYGNVSGGISTSGSGITNTITYSLVQGETGGSNGNLNGILNPHFVSPLANNIKSDLGDYHLKDSSPCINVGTDIGISPLDLDRNLRPKGGKTDMGAYESNVNMNEIISIATGNWETPATWNLDRVPLQTDKVIMNGHNVTVTTPNAKAKNVEQKPSSDLKFNAGGSLQLNQ
jgi:hypothetical protein